jgi:hypothetical protein
MSPPPPESVRLFQNHGCKIQLGSKKLHSATNGLSVVPYTRWINRFGQLPEGGGGALGPMDSGGLGNVTVADIVVGIPSTRPV